MNAVIVKYLLVEIISVLCIALVSTHQMESINSNSQQTTEESIVLSEEQLNNSTGSFDNKIFCNYYSEWSSWGRCSKNCLQSRKRRCKKKEYCGRSFFKEKRPCRKKRGRCYSKLYGIFGSNRRNRKIEDRLYDIFYKPWTSWTPCAKSCRKRRHRKCKEVAVCGGGYLEEETSCRPQKFSKCNKIYTFESNGYRVKEDRRKVKSSGKNCTLDSLEKICGHRPSKGSFRIIGGRDSKPHSWPWQVLLLNRRKKHFCGGTLISPRWVLTAAHCIRKRGRRRKVVVRTGEHDISVNEGTEKDIKVEKDFPHPDFDYKTIINDIALLKLTVPIKRSNVIGYACLPTKGPKIHRGKLCKTVGWGKTKMTNLKGSDVLQEAEIPIVKKKKCKRAFDFTITNTQICAGYKKGGIDSCTGDSGGPLLCPLKSKQNDTRWYVTGVTSYGEECGQKGKFGIYTNVVRYIPWITEVIDTN